MTRCLRLSLILCLALTGFALASARGQAMIGDRAVLCSGQAVILTYGPDGTPVESPQYCPDMAMALMAAVAVAVPGDLPVVAVRRLVFALTIDRGAEIPRIVARARDPPRSALA